MWYANAEKEYLSVTIESEIYLAEILILDARLSHREEKGKDLRWEVYLHHPLLLFKAITQYLKEIQNIEMIVLPHKYIWIWYVVAKIRNL